MKTQFDHSVRIVSLDNLEAMCKRVSGVCHRYRVVKASRSRVTVEYSNPDEYGAEHPMLAVFPCYPSTFEGSDNPAVVLEIMNVLHDNWDGEGWQAFDVLLSCEKLTRFTNRTNPEKHPSIWLSSTEIAKENERAAEQQ